jgi:hypothetical protein
MGRVAHRRVLLRLYEDVPQHQEILHWLDGYSGRGLQEILRGALLIGLPQLLSARPGPARRPEPERKSEFMQRPESMPVEPIQQTPEPVRKPEPVVRTESGPMPDFVPSQGGDVPSQGGETAPSNEAHGALKKLFEWKG